MKLQFNISTALERISLALSHYTLHHLIQWFQFLSPPYQARSPILNYRRRIQAQGQEFTPWGIDRVNASSLWAIPPKQEVKICLIDTGYDLNHPDLSTTNVNGWVRNTTCGTKLTNGDWSVDENGHGTFTSGIVGAIGNNGELEIVLSANRITLYI